MNWGPKSVGLSMFEWLTFDPRHALVRPWTFVTSGILTEFDTYRHAFWSLLGLYFLTPDLEKRWGPWRLVRFFLFSIAFGNLAVLLAAINPIAPKMPIFGFAFGPTAAITATAIAWALENRNKPDFCSSCR
jgi:membrane associated rhomboid family serine protease